MVWRLAVNPCLRAFFEQRSRPAVFGPPQLPLRLLILERSSKESVMGGFPSRCTFKSVNNYQPPPVPLPAMSAQSSYSHYQEMGVNFSAEISQNIPTFQPRSSYSFQSVQSFLSRSFP